MARSFLTAINLNKNELQNAAVQNLGAAPSTPVKGQLYFNSTGGDNTLYWWDGTTWIPAKATGGAFPGYGAVPAETTFGITKNDGAATTVARSDHTHGSPTHDAAAHNTIPLSAHSAAVAAINMGGFVINNVGAPVAGTDAANKTYVDNLQAGLSWKEAVRAATTANGTLASAFANGQTIDGVVLATGNRILLKNQTTGLENGIYTVNASGAPTRATDADAVGELEQATVFIQEGTALKDTAWTCTTDGVITPGTTATVWAQFGAGTAYTAGAGLVLNTATFDVVAADASIVVTADAVAVGYAGTGSAATAARSDHTHSIYTRKYTAAVANAVSTVINHALATLDTVVEVYRVASPFDKIECDVEHTDANNVTVRFVAAPTAGEYRVVVVG